MRKRYQPRFRAAAFRVCCRALSARPLVEPFPNSRNREGDPREGPFQTPGRIKVVTDTHLVVREARPDEWHAAGELAVRAYRAGGHDAIDNGYLEVVLDAASRAIPGPLFVALRDDVIVGTGTLCAPGTSHAELCRDDECEFRFLAVEPDAWGTGVAAALLDALEAHAREAGARQLVCCVITWNEPAHRLYVARGYQRIPERDWLPIPEVTLLAYALPLA